MKSIKSILSMSSASSPLRAVGSTRKSRTSLLGALALCAVVVVASTPVYPSSRNADVAPPSNDGKVAPTETAEQAAALHHTVAIGKIMSEGDAQVQPEYFYSYWTVHPFSKKFLIAEFAYDSSNCAWISAGNWYNSSPSYPSSSWHNALNYGSPSQKIILVKAVSGSCKGFYYKAAAAYYYWNHSTGSIHNAVLGGTWRGAGLTVPWNFRLYLR